MARPQSGPSVFPQMLGPFLWLTTHMRVWIGPEPLAASSDLMSGQAREPIMSHWHDTMVDRPEADGTVYVTGWTISGLAVLAVIFAVWVFAI